jgi:hypothetical protein
LTKQSQIAPEPLPPKDLTPPSPQSPNLQITQSPIPCPAADRTIIAVCSSAGPHPANSPSRNASRASAARAMPSNPSAEAA